MLTARSSKVAAVDNHLAERDAFLEDIRECLLQAQVTMKHYHDQKRSEVTFNEGDWVWLG